MSLTSASVAVLAASFAVAAAGCGNHRVDYEVAKHGAAHGKVVAYLPIPYRVTPGADTGSAKIVKVLVRPGERFAVKVDTSAGPARWSQVGPVLAARVIQAIGNVDDGYCPAAPAGCGIPYFYVMRAKMAGHTSMTWLYRKNSCVAVRKKMSQWTRTCAATITFDITVR